MLGKESFLILVGPGQIGKMGCPIPEMKQLSRLNRVARLLVRLLIEITNLMISYVEVKSADTDK